MGNRAETKPSRMGLTGKIIFRVGLAVGAGSLAGIAIDCGGGSDNTPASSNTPIHPDATGTPSQIATATKVTESPTPAPTPAETKIPTTDEVFSLIDQALTQTPYVGNTADSEPKNLKKILQDCNSDLQPFTPLFNSALVDPSDSHYGAMVSLQCQRVARVTKEAYEKTKNENFFLANQALMKIHKKVYDNFGNRYPELNSSFWTDIKDTYYSLK